MKSRNRKETISADIKSTKREITIQTIPSVSKFKLSFGGYFKQFFEISFYWWQFKYLLDIKQSKHTFRWWCEPNPWHFVTQRYDIKHFNLSHYKWARPKEQLMMIMKVRFKQILWERRKSFITYILSSIFIAFIWVLNIWLWDFFFDFSIFLVTIN